MFATAIWKIIYNFPPPVENENIKEEIIKIAYITDNNYINHTRTSINSIKANKNPNTNIIINVLGNNLSPEEINKIKNEQTDTVKINFIPIKIQHKTDYFKNSDVTRYITKIVYTKFILASLFPNENKILYLDSDTLILKDLSNLYNIDLQDSYAGVADDWEVGWYDHRITRYFNDGIMLLNLKKIREDEIEYKLCKYKQNKDKNRFTTQDCFNTVMRNKVKYISLIYNTVNHAYVDKNVIKKIKKLLKWHYNKKIYPYKNSKEYHDNVVIIHYAGLNKPWLNTADIDTVTRQLWYKYVPKD